MLVTGNMTSDDEREIDALMGRFMDAFTNVGGRSPRLDDIPSMFVDGGILANRSVTPMTVMSVEAFVAPRRGVLSDGTLVDFREHETEARTSIDRSIATRTSRYAKRGVRLGVPFEGGGAKVSTLVKTEGGWRILSLVWEDDPPA